MDRDKFAAWCNGQGMRQTTIGNYLWCLDKIPDDVLSDAAKLGDWLYTADFRPSSKYAIVSSIRTYYRFLKRPKQEIESFSFPKLKEKRRFDWLLEKQIKELYENCANDMERIIIKFLLETGVRKSIILEITPSDFDWTKGIIKIKSFFLGNKGKVEYDRPISPELQQMLRNFITANKIGHDDKVIRFVHGRNIPYRNQQWVLWRVTKNIGRRCNMPWLYPHVLRHTFASHYNQERHDPFALASAMGDKQVESVRPYVHSLADEKKVHASVTKSMFGR